MDFFDDFLTAIQQDIASNLSSCMFKLLTACFKLKNVLKIDIFDYSMKEGVYFWGHQLVVDFYQSTINIATIISAVIFFIQFINISRKMESLNFELLFATLAKVVLARFCIEIGGEVLSAIASTGYSLFEKMFDASGIQDMGNNLDVYDMKLQGIMSNMPQLGFGKSIIMLVTTMIPQLICQLAVLVIEIFGYVRLFEMSVYYCLFPIPCAFLPAEDSRITKKFFLSFAAVCLQGVIMMLILSLVIEGMANEILFKAESEWGTGWDFVTTGTLRMVLWGILAVVGIGQSSKWASKIVEY